MRHNLLYCPGSRWTLLSKGVRDPLMRRSLQRCIPLSPPEDRSDVVALSLMIVTMALMVPKIRLVVVMEEGGW